MPIIELTTKQKREVVNALLKCPIMQTRHGRDDVVNQLGESISGNIERRENPRSDITNIFGCCLNYEDGLKRLIDAIHFFEDESVPFQDFQRLITNFQIGYGPSLSKQTQETCALSEVSNKAPKNSKKASRRSRKSTLSRRLDAAMPKESQVNRTTEVRFLIAMLDSDGLRAFLPDYSISHELIEKNDVNQAGIPIEFPKDPNTDELLPANVFVEIQAPDFRLDQISQQVLIPPDKDSGVITFFLTPNKRLSVARVSVELYADKERTIQLGSVVLITKVKSASSTLVSNVWGLISFPYKLPSTKSIWNNAPLSPPPTKNEEVIVAHNAVQKRKPEKTGALIVTSQKKGLDAITCDGIDMIAHNAAQKRKPEKTGTQIVTGLKKRLDTLISDDIEKIKENPSNFVDVFLDKAASVFLDDVKEKETAKQPLPPKALTSSYSSSSTAKTNPHKEIQQKLNDLLSDPDNYSLDDLLKLWVVFVDPSVDWVHETRRFQQPELAQRLVMRATRQKNLHKLAQAVLSRSQLGWQRSQTQRSKSEK